MQFTEVKSEGLKREYTVVVSNTYLDECLTERLAKIGKTAKIPGFRPGKIPMPILKQRYGTSVQGEVLEKAVKDGIAALVKDKNLKPALQPDVKIDKYEEKSDLEMTVSLEVLPDFKTPDLGKLKFVRLTCEATDAEIDEVLQRIATDNASPQDLKKARASKKGDVLVIDFTGSVGGEVFKGGTAEGVSLELGSGSFIPGFEDQLIGKKAGDQVDVKVTFPEDYHEKTLAGKEALSDTKIQKIQEKATPEISDEFAKTVGFDDLAKLREAIKKQIDASNEEMAFLVAKRAVLDKLADVSKFEAPEGLVTAEFDAIWRQYEAQLGADNDAAGEEKKPTAEAQEADKKQYREIADRRVRLGLVLAEIGREYDISVLPNELNQAVVEAARRYRGQEQEAYKYLRGNDRALAELRAPIFENKVVRLILDKAETTDKKASSEELKKAAKAVTEGDEA